MKHRFSDLSTVSHIWTCTHDKCKRRNKEVRTDSSYDLARNGTPTCENNNCQSDLKLVAVEVDAPVKLLPGDDVTVETIGGAMVQSRIRIVHTKQTRTVALNIERVEEDPVIAITMV